MKPNKLHKKVTDFIKLDQGSIGRKSAMVTGATLASSVLGAMWASTAEANCHCDVPAHSEWHFKYGIPICYHCNAHYDNYGPPPCDC